MKTKLASLLIISSALLFMTNQANASENKLAEEKLNIEQFIKYPESARSDNLSDQVSIAFKINNEGKVEIESIESEYDVFKKSVQEQLSKIIFEQLDTNKIYRLIIKFNLL
jgi:outer membrane biosynthesis protein TonB